MRLQPARIPLAAGSSAMQLTHRRQLLKSSALGFGHLALTALVGATARAQAPANDGLNPLLARPSHFAARAKRVLFLFMKGGPSHVDTFDPKPALSRDHGTLFPCSEMSATLGRQP